MSSVSDKTLDRISAAALALFARHGFQRTSMADVAAAAKVARATLYLRFTDKSALFAYLAARLTDTCLADAAAAWDAAAPLAPNLAATLLAKDLPLYRLLHASPHGAELLGVDAEATRAQAQRLVAGTIALIAARVEAIDHGAFGDAQGLARFAVMAAAGLKREARSEDDFTAAVERLTWAIARAVGCA